jgi:3-phenylpropionate/trans-cinnamate dioxygenase ferredoxin reductase subunit
MVIVGSGECGARAAMELRLGGWTGGIVLIGDEPAHPYERPPLSKAALVSVDELVDTTVYTAQHLAEAGVRYLPGRTVTAVDPAAHQVTLDDGWCLEYSKLLLATGARFAPWPTRSS